ncbi:methionine adenosyltransferase [Aminithiophilus ramosus]|uniref:S-adenosylmethionine synthase n=2 Tax=Synergistales TaxID=649776 RepID=A0A9Q7EYQ1_9BACT|nr:methionine adenosyltransferase [Aminithiophilus ramosus]QTX31482.1 methionine adenosyltransferase [Aminithiophilus ramosus]QVL35292.1 methionine adenosyltransferase [Synergistota bacterium]
MEKERFLLTSESVTEGHPDKLADQVSDGILDAILAQDPFGRVACETLVTTGLVVVAGEISTSCYVDIPRLAREIVKDIGYTRAKFGFDGDTCAIITAIDEQSGDIKEGVDRALEIRDGLLKEDFDGLGAGDQGMMIGYACDETEEFLPLPIALAHRLARRLSTVRKEGLLSYLRPDGKTQVTVEYEEGRALRVDTVVVSTQHGPEAEQERIRRDVIEHVIRPVVPAGLLDDETHIFVNPSGRFVMGGPMADTGLTGRKIIVDTYGGLVPHGGGAFSGKDPTKVDRSAAYMARYAAKNVVAAGLAERCQIQVAYAIGVARPVSIMANSYGTGKISDEAITRVVRACFDFRPAAIIADLELRKPQYRRLAAYGHMGRIDLDPLPAWERVDRTEALRRAAGL